MSARRGASGLSGIVLVDKPAGCTSHDVVNRVRRAASEKRVGHAGTLDPMATGLLVVLVGPATRLAAYLTAEHKSYTATIAFGTATDTDDAEGEIVRTAEVPPEAFASEYAAGVLRGFLGESMQRPPAYSAIKVGGKAAHRSARAGEAIELANRPIEVVRADLLATDADARTWDVEFCVSKGTYIRSLARDIGEACGTAAHLAALRRTMSGGLSVTDAHSLDEVMLAGERCELKQLFATPGAVFSHLPHVVADPAVVATGRSLPAPPEATGGRATRSDDADDLIAVFDNDQRLLALYRRGTAGVLVPEVVMAIPVSGATQ